MAKIDYLSAKFAQKAPKRPEDFFDLMIGPPVSAFFTPQEVDYVKHIILRNKNDVKINMLNAIMKSKGFTRLSGGTNRMVYKYYDDPNFVLKVALDRVGLKDNLAEYKNQHLLKPYVCKIFDTTPCGTMATIERVIPITSKEEFQAVSKEIFYTIVTKIIGLTVAEDIGKNYFRNWGIRPNFGVVLLDYPYVYRVDGSKLFCNKIDEFGRVCTGLIDYDDGFNHLFCTKCGKRYLALDLEDKNPANDMVITRGGKYPMKVIVTTSDGQRIEPISSSSIMSKPKPTKNGRFGALKVKVSGVPEKEKKEKAIEVQQEQSVEIKVEETHAEEVKASDKVEVPKPIEIEQPEPIKEDEVKETPKKEETVKEENIKVIEVEPQKVVPPEIVSADTKPVKKSTKTASKAKVAKGAKVSSSKSSVKSNFIESKE